MWRRRKPRRSSLSITDRLCPGARGVVLAGQRMVFPRVRSGAPAGPRWAWSSPRPGTPVPPRARRWDAPGGRGRATDTNRCCLLWRRALGRSSPPGYGADIRTMGPGCPDLIWETWACPLGTPGGAGPWAFPPAPCPRVTRAAQHTCSGRSAHLLAVSSGFSAGAEGEEGEPPHEGLALSRAPCTLQGQVCGPGDS